MHVHGWMEVGCMAQKIREIIRWSVLAVVAVFTDD